MINRVRIIGKYFLGIVFVLIFVAIVLFYSSKQATMSQAEKVEFDQLAIILADPLDCQQNIKGMMVGDSMTKMSECPLSERLFDTQTGQFACRTSPISKNIVELVVKIVAISKERSESTILISNRSGIWTKQIVALTQISDGGKIESCHPQTSLIIEERKKKLESYPGAGAINL